MFCTQAESHQHSPETCCFPPAQFSVAGLIICLAHQYLLLLNNSSSLTRMTRSQQKKGEREGKGEEMEGDKF